MPYKVQESQGRYSITLNSDLVKSKGWEKQQGLDLKIVGNKIKITEGDHVSLQEANHRFFISVPVAEEMGWEKSDIVIETVDGNGDLVLKKQ